MGDNDLELKSQIFSPWEESFLSTIIKGLFCSCPDTLLITSFYLFSNSNVSILEFKISNMLVQLLALQASLETILLYRCTFVVAFKIQIILVIIVSKKLRISHNLNTIRN